MKKPQLLKLLMVLAVVLYTTAGVLAGNRILSKEELVRLVQVDPTYKENVVLDASGNYVDNNSEEAYRSTLAKAAYLSNGQMVDFDQMNLNSGLTPGSVKLPALTVTGNESADISAYKETLKTWLSANASRVEGLDPASRELLGKQDYRSLYRLALKNNNVNQ